MMLARRLAACVLAVALAGCHRATRWPVAVPTPGRATLAGEVRSGTRGPALQQVVVRLTDVAHLVRDSAITDVAGRFTFRDVPPGTVYLELRRLGFAPHQLRVELLAGEQRRQRIALRAPSGSLHADCLAPDGRSMGSAHCR